MTVQKHKYLFIDRDGTLIHEPEDKQIDSFEKFDFLTNVIPALQSLVASNYTLVMVTNQDGLGTDAYPAKDFDKIQALLIKLLASQGIVFKDILICPHLPEKNCQCRKPKLGLLMPYLTNQSIDIDHSYVIGDRKTDLELANNLGIQGIKIGSDKFPDWSAIARSILTKPRKALVVRVTKETAVEMAINLDDASKIDIQTGIDFFDHMLEQIATHANISMQVKAVGDLNVDDHHTVEDVAIVLGQALRECIADKIGIERYGFVLPMDEALAHVVLDLSGRPMCAFEADFKRESVGKLSTELVPHFFQTLADNLKAAIHIKLTGDNTHHIIEAAFKGFGRALKQAVHKSGTQLPSTKGAL